MEPTSATPADISRVNLLIVNETFTTMPSGKLLICELTLSTGETLRGEAAIAQGEALAVKKAQALSRDIARDKVWTSLGFTPAPRAS